jgi:hypothetical protein
MYCRLWVWNRLFELDGNCFLGCVCGKILVDVDGKSAVGSVCGKVWLCCPVNMLYAVGLELIV